MSDLGTLPGDSSYGSAINVHGEITGGTFMVANSFYHHAFLYSGGVMTDLGTLVSPTTLCCSSAGGINDSGQVTGSSSTDGPGEPYHAFLYTDGVMTDLGSLGPANSSSWGAGINASGQITGTTSSSQPDAQFHAFLYSGGSMQDLGTLDGSSSYGMAINASGHVVGRSYIPNGAQHAFLYANGEMKDLNALIDPLSGWMLEEATAINDRGQILGTGWVGGEWRGFLLTPVPEPQSWLLFGLGAIALACSHARIKNKLKRSSKMH
jgi:probable HAF family extracellular repeat protein